VDTHILIRIYLLHLFVYVCNVLNILLVMLKFISIFTIWNCSTNTLNHILESRSLNYKQIFLKICIWISLRRCSSFLPSITIWKYIYIWKFSYQSTFHALSLNMIHLMSWFYVSYNSFKFFGTYCFELIILLVFYILLLRCGK